MASGQRAYGRSLSANAFDGYGAVQLGILGGLMVLSLYHLRIRRQPSSDVFHDLKLAELHHFASDEMDIVCSVFLSRPKKEDMKSTNLMVRLLHLYVYEQKKRGRFPSSHTIEQALKNPCTDPLGKATPQKLDPAK